MQIKSERNDLFFNQPLFGQTPTAQPQRQQVPSQQGAPAIQSSRYQANNAVTKPTENEEEFSEDQIDIESIKGRFGWTEVTNINIPYLVRKGQKYVSVRIVEQKILSKYPNSYPDEIKKRPPLESHFITLNEAKLLNEINYNHCGCEYGKKEFTKTDLIVLLADFIEFLNFVQNTFPEKGNQVKSHQGNTLPQVTRVDHRGDSAIKETCGWLQINNTVTPYLTRIKEKFVPVSIMKYAAKINLKDEGFLPTKEECDLLNRMCTIAGFRFVFTSITRIISLSTIRIVHSVIVKELPSDNPLSHVKYVEQNSEKSKTQGGSGNVTLDKYFNMGQPKSNGNVMTSAVSLAQKQSQPTASITKTVAQGPVLQQNVPTGLPRPVMTTSSTVNPSVAGNFLYLPPNSGSSTIQQQLGQSAVSQSSQYGAMQIPFSNPLGLIYPNLGVPYDVTKQYLRPAVVQSQTYTAATRPPPPYSFSASSVSRPPTTTLSTTVTNASVPSLVQSNHNVQRHSSVQHQINNKSSSLNNETRDTSPANKNQFRTNTTVNTDSALDLTSSTNKTAEKTKQMPVLSRPSKTIPRMGNIPETVAHALKDALSKRKQEMQSAETKKGSSQSNTTVSSSAISAVTQSKGASHPPASNAQVETQSSSDNSQTVKQQTLTKNNVRQPAAVSSLTNSIRVETVAGRSISCMHRINGQPKGKFCLVEVICRLYFNGCSVNEFLFTLKNVFRIIVYSCTDQEEKAFIQYYSLHVTALKCNKLMNADDLDKFYPQLSYVFKSNSDQNQQFTPNRHLMTKPNNKRKADSPPDLPPSKRSERSNQVKGIV